MAENAAGTLFQHSRLPSQIITRNFEGIHHMLQMANLFCITLIQHDIKSGWAVRQLVVR